MIQDIYPHKLDNQYSSARAPQDDDKVFCFYNGELLLKEENGFDLPQVKDFEEEELQYLFSIDEEPYYLAKGSEEMEKEGFSYTNIRSFTDRIKNADPIVYGSFTAKHLMDWYRDNQFCGRCGHKMNHSDRERAMVCPDCGYTSYPRIMPAVIVGVTKGDEILITKYRTGFRHHALIAGFTEIGETLEETVAREVMEEAGVKVKNIRYYKSQPWGTANDILIGYYCDVDGDPTIHMDDNELGYAEWTKREDIILQPNRLSLTNEMMMMFKEGKI
ncbi:MAG: NAD(+) diphosphatase [Eubacteriales bacterium]|nr:NAD(+) diphosphatase [Eubacteriales bacterium]